ncbi:hypothetical protein D9611_003163 [Ephemerocybe angulata]|uniref:P-loop containing nucleoside triphosphate hydrolase protein n=1 Tax=Ephemerocybe angulata TaxID=980116 RepID=A0A8H5CAQ2_9AGAR|nr:hypothetical protein D9611_003163 [Tulosesus angulatus]
MFRLRCRLGPRLSRQSHTGSPSVVLRPYQDECIKECLDWLDQGATRIGVSLPTGSGKTTVFISLLSRLASLKEAGMRTIVIVNSVELARQSAAQAQRMFPHWSVEIEQGAKHKASGFADFTVATYQTLLNPERLAKFDPHKVNAIIIDEAHHAAAPSYRKLLSHFHTDIRHPDREYIPPVEPGRIPIIGFSATFSRHDGLALGSVFERIVYHRDVLQMIDEEWLCEVRLTSVRVKLDLNTVKLNATGDFSTSSLASVMNTPTMNDLVVRTWLDRAADRKSTLIFCVDIAHVQALAESFRNFGVDARFLTGKTNVNARKELVTAFKAQEFPVLINCAVLTEGADIPNIDCVIVARPTRSKNVFAQIIGRGMRLSPGTGKKDCHIIDYVDTVNRMPGVMSVPTLLGLDPMQLKIESVFKSRPRYGSGLRISLIHPTDTSLEDLREQAKKPAVDLGSTGPQPDKVPRGSASEGIDDGKEPRAITYEEHGSLENLTESLKDKEMHIRSLSRFAWVTCNKNLHILQGFKALKIKLKRSGEEYEVKRYIPIYSRNAGAMIESSFTLLTAATLEDAVHGADKWIVNKVGGESQMLCHFAPWRKSAASTAQVKQIMNIYAKKPPNDVRAFLAAIGLILDAGREVPTRDEIEARLKVMKRGRLHDAITRLKHNASEFLLKTVPYDV